MKTAKTKKSKREAPKPPEFPCVVETFKLPSAWARSQLTAHEAYCFNGVVSVRRYRITFEEIEEPVEVIRERILKLWRESDNHHHWSPLREAAAKVGLELDIQEVGKNRKKPQP